MQILLQATFIYALMMLAWFAAGGVEVNAAVKYNNDSYFNILGIKFTKEHQQELFRRRAAAAVSKNDCRQLFFVLGTFFFLVYLSRKHDTCLCSLISII